MSAIDGIRMALHDGLDSARWMQDNAQRWPARERAAANISSLKQAIAACDKLSLELRDGRKHIEPPDDFKHTECYCSAPTCSPPCSWCTDPANNEEEDEVAPSLAASTEPAFMRPEKWTLLLTGDNNGLVGTFGNKFEGHPEHYERVNVFTHTATQAAHPTEQDDPIRALIAKHGELLEENDYCYFELARTRYTDWMAWICTNSIDLDKGRQVIAKGQGGTPDEACADALAAILASQSEKGERA